MKTKKSILVITTIFVFLFVSFTYGAAAKDKKITKEKIDDACSGLAAGAAAGTAIVAPGPAKALAPIVYYGVKKVCNAGLNKMKEEAEKKKAEEEKKKKEEEEN